MVVANQPGPTLERVVSCSSPLVGPAHNLPWLWQALLISCIGSGTIFLEMSFSSTLPTGTLLLRFEGVDLMTLLEIGYLRGEFAECLE